MSDIVAFIVGIEKYLEHDWDVTSPCRNAIAVAQRLLAIGAEPQNIFMFINHMDDNVIALQQDVADLTAKGINIEAPTFGNIDARFKRLAEGRLPNSCLFFYWSGHGYITREHDRLFICHDYTVDLDINKAFNATHRFKRLKSTAFGVFSEQLLLADVCAQYVKQLKFGSDKEPLDDPLDETHQTQVFATPDGEYARVEGDMGAFTSIVLSVLCATDKWPKLQSFRQSLTEAVRKSDAPRFKITGSTAEGEFLDEHVGRLSRDADAKIIRGAYNLLCNVAVPYDEILRHYIATVANLGQPGLDVAQGLLGMVRELGKLQDGFTCGQMSYGLLQFLMRVSTNEADGMPVRVWLEGLRDPGVINARSKIAELVAAEQEKRILVVEIDHNETEDPSSLTWSVWSPSHKRMPGGQASPQTIHNWDDLCKLIRKILNHVEGHGESTEISEVHFVVEPPLFDLRFHHIELEKDDQTLGERYIVVARHSSRLRMGKTTPMRQSWENRAQAFWQRAGQPIRLIRVPSNGTNLPRLFHDGDGLCYAGFILDRAPGRRSVERRVINQLVGMGVAYIYWLHQAPPAQDWQHELESYLKLWLKGCGNFHKFPSVIREQRAGRDELALHATLMWDEPQFIPVMQKIAPRQG